MTFQEVPAGNHVVPSDPCHDPWMTGRCH